MMNALNRFYAVLQNGNKAEGKSSPLLPDEAQATDTKLKRREESILQRRRVRETCVSLRLNDSYQQPTG